MRKEDLKNWTRDMLKDKILYQEALLEQRNKDIEIISKRAKELNDENDLVKAENASLKQRIKDLEDACDIRYFLDGKDLIEGLKKHMGDDMCTSNIPFDDSAIDYDALIAELQDQHQQDCIKINQLHVTIDTLVDKYSRLRKTVGMD